MKFLVSFLFALAQSAPEKGGNLERWYADGIERDPCVYNTDLENGKPVVYWNEDSSGLRGNVTFQRYQDNQDCWVPIGSSCKVGVEAEFTYVQVQAKRDNVHFTYMTQNGWFGHAAGVSGCYPSIACDLNHPWITIKKISPMLEIGKYVMEGIDHQVKLMSDGSQSGGTVKLSWSCLPEKPTTTTTLLTTTTTSTTKLRNVFEMAEARLTGRFKPLNAANYGCAGRGYFDPFRPTAGKHVDPTDKAFYLWKKCVQCALSNDGVTPFKGGRIQPYQYDEQTDYCGG